MRVETIFGQSYLTIDIDRVEIARHGINVAIRGNHYDRDRRDALPPGLRRGSALTSFFVFQRQYRGSVDTTISNIS